MNGHPSLYGCVHLFWVFTSHAVEHSAEICLWLKALPLKHPDVMCHQPSEVKLILHGSRCSLYLCLSPTEEFLGSE